MVHFIPICTNTINLNTDIRVNQPIFEMGKHFLVRFSFKISKDESLQITH